MPTHTEKNLSFSVSENTVESFGNQLVLINPKSIQKLYKAMIEHYPVQASQLPEIPKYDFIEPPSPEVEGFSISSLVV